MNRRILIRAAAPATVVGLFIWAACIAAAWYVNKLQLRVAHIFSDNVSSLESSDQLEINLRRLCFHRFLYQIDPAESLLETIRDDEVFIEKWLARSEELAFTQVERHQLEIVRNAYLDYRADFEGTLSRPALARPRYPGFRELAKTLSIRHMLDPCQDYHTLNQAMMEAAAEQAELGSRNLRWLLMFLGVFGPLGGLVSGYGIARHFSFSLQGLKLRLRDLGHHLKGDPGSQPTQTADAFQQLDRELAGFVQRAACVSERLVRQEREILRSRQLAALGQLAASVAHEVRNPLTAIKLLVEAGIRPSRPRPMTLEKLQVVYGEIMRLEQRVQAFLDFARPPAFQGRPCDLGELLNQAVQLMRPRARQQGVQISTNSPESGPTSLADRGQLCTVLVNLFLNALDAMPLGGSLMIDLSHLGKGYAVMGVADTGTGIDERLIDQLFEPFVTSKPAGSGLGLSICKRVVEEHGGRISGRNLPGGGACFTIILPCEAQEHQHAIVTDR
jgi:signal transduction histidine kinase